MTDQRPKPDDMAQAMVRNALSHADPSLVSNELQLALFKSNSLHVTDQMRATLNGFTESLLHACTALIACVDGDASAPSLDTGGGPQLLRLTPVFLEPATLLLLFSRAWEAQLAQAAASCGRYLPQSPEILSQDGEKSQMLMRAQAQFLSNAEVMRLDRGELSATQWRRIVLRLAHKINAHGEDLETRLREATKHLLLDHDEAAARLTQMAMYLDQQRNIEPSHQGWRQSGPSLFLLSIAERIDMPFDALIMVSAMDDPLIFALCLLAAGIAPQDILLIMGETPMASKWYASTEKATNLATVIAHYDKDSAQKELTHWLQDDGVNGQSIFDPWPWGAA